MLSTFGTLNGTLLTSPRIFFAMADDGLFFRTLAAVHPRFQTPYVAIAMTAALGVIFVLLAHLRAARRHLRDGHRAVLRAGRRVGIHAAQAGRLRVRRSGPRCIRSCRSLFVLATIFILVNAIADPTSRWPTVAVLGIILLGVPVYYFTVGKHAVGQRPEDLGRV